MFCSRQVLSVFIMVLMYRSIQGVTLGEYTRHKQKPRNSTCVLGGKIYEEGARWHPFLRPFGLMNCTTCYCLEGGEVTCWRESCPSVRCMNPVTNPGDCCPTCPGADAVEEDDDSEEDLGPFDQSTRRSCTHFGQVYRDGERFSSSRTALQPTKMNQCVLCVCLDGNVYCHLRTCFAHTCSQMFTVEDDCCPICADCVTDDRIYSNGSTWNPVVETVGEIPCVTCSCLNGEISCKKKPCPSEADLPCENPVQLEGNCCKTCPTRVRNTTTFSRGGKKRTTIVLPGARGRSDGANNKILPGTPAPVRPSGKACLPRGTDTYLHQWQNKTSVVVVFEFKITATVFTFDVIRNRVTEINSQCLRKDKLNAMLNRRRDTTLVGATTIRRIEKFKRRVNRWFRECKRTKCRTRSIRRLMRALKAKNIVYKEAC